MRSEPRHQGTLMQCHISHLAPNASLWVTFGSEARRSEMHGQSFSRNMPRRLRSPRTQPHLELISMVILLVGFTFG
ncbi:hypothetical protein CEP54_012175 [Fusarium duplospermum]|uniref:Uncharacterized protein n=1 Tax=Fusarium duplospermum TaxID=1325734 RepID=A0A428PA53_9HYPO|nr:hypothetical protein CEP54_012175 [Fusarium duplospermum]